MKIESVRFDHWMYHNHIALDFAPMTMIVGPNECGKTCLADGISFGMTGLLPRGLTKAGDRDQLVTDGTKDGSVEIGVAGGKITRDIVTSRTSGSKPPIMPENVVRSAITICLGQRRFSGALPDDRNKMLQAIMRVDCGPLRVLQELEKRDHPANLIAALKHPDGSPKGDPAEWIKLAERSATEARGGWSAIAGERYGSAKAKDFVFPASPMPEDQSVNQSRLIDLDAQITALDREIGALDALAASDEGKRTTLAAKAQLLPMARDAVATAMAAKAELSAGYARSQAECDRLVNLSRQKELICPDCGSSLWLENGALTSLISSPKFDQSDLDAARVDEARWLAALVAKDDEITTLTIAVRDAASAERSLAAMPAPVERRAVPEGLRSDVERQRQAATTEREKLRAAITRANTAAQDVREATQKTAQLAGLHAVTLAWIALAADLAPDGIPRELLQKVLGPFNDLLRAFSEATGWKQVTVSADMSVRAAGRLYSLLSMSAQWRVDVMLTCAVAIFAEVRFAVIDEFDVLEPAARAKALGWMRGLIQSGQLDSILVMATMKARPQVPPDIAVHWLGEPIEAQRAAA